MMTPTSFADDEMPSNSLGSRVRQSVHRILSVYLDRTTLYSKSRWFCLLILTSLFAVRVYLLQGFFIVTYAVAIYLLNLLLGFLTPQIDPESEGYVLPVREAEEYRPFQRRLPEFKFWMHSTKAICLALAATFISALDLPVFWPVLFIYFVLLFFMTMKQQIKHMVKHKYVPFSWGKQTYGDITRHGIKKPNAFDNVLRTCWNEAVPVLSDNARIREQILHGVTDWERWMHASANLAAALSEETATQEVLLLDLQNALNEQFNAPPTFIPNISESNLESPDEIFSAISSLEATIKNEVEAEILTRVINTMSETLSTLKQEIENFSVISDAC